MESTVLEDDTMFKDYTFQFPAWLTGTHQVEVNYFNDTENYESTIIVTMSITALSSSSQAPSAPGELARPERPTRLRIEVATCRFPQAR